MHARVAVIVNSNAGYMRRDPGLASRLRDSAAGAAQVHVTHDLDSLQIACAELAERDVATVGVVGGDSTASMTLTALWRAYATAPLPRVALLRGGTMNTVAGSLGVPRRSPVRLLTMLLSTLERSQRCRICRRPLIDVNGRLGFLFGTGVWYGYLAETYRKGPPTLGINVEVLGRVFASAAINGATIRRITRPTPVALRFDQESWPERAYLSIAAGTVPDVGFGFRPFQRAFASADGFQLLAVQGSAREVLRELPSVWLGRGFAQATARQTLTKRVELTAAQGCIEYSVDGDIDLVYGPLCLALGPSFEFLCL